MNKIQCAWNWWKVNLILTSTHSIDLLWNAYLTNIYVCVCVWACVCMHVYILHLHSGLKLIIKSLLIKSTSILSPSCWPGVYVEYIWQPSAFSTVTHPLSPQIHLLSAAGPQQVQRKAWLMGIINTPAVERLGGNKGPNSNFSVPSSSRSENTLCDRNMLESPSVTFPLQEETLQVNRALTAVPPSGLLTKVPTGSWALVILVCLSF